MTHPLQGTYAAVVTPFDGNGNLSAEQFDSCLQHLATRGCHGALVAGTTGEAASLSATERASLFDLAAADTHGLRILAGTGAASLEDAASITRAAYEAGCDATVIIPPFFYKGATDDGFFDYYRILIARAVPSDGAVILYHNPVATAVGLSIELVKRLRDAYPEQVIGIKDSSQDWDNTQTLIKELPDFLVLVGDDRLLGQALATGGGGSITLVSNAFPDMPRAVFDAHQSGQPVEEAQARLSNAHAQFNGLPRIPAVKSILKAGGIISNDAVRPPLRPLSADEMALLKERFLLDVEIPQAVTLNDLYDANQP